MGTGKPAAIDPNVCAGPVVRPEGVESELRRLASIFRAAGFGAVRAGAGGLVGSDCVGWV